MSPRLRIASTVLSTRDAQSLAAFYERLLGWPRVADEPGWVILDIATDDLEAAVAHAVDCGARVAAHQPQAGVRVLLDPDDHPFCLFATPTGEA